LIVCAVCIFMLPLLKKERLKIAGIVQSITAAIAASVSFSMAMWFLAFVIELRGYREDLSINSLDYGFGFYISMAFSSIALITGIAAVVKGLRQLRCDNKNDGPVVSGGFV